ncbi:MAG: universal stress protein [Gammaproteobacteria bacterium]
MSDDRRTILYATDLGENTEYILQHTLKLAGCMDARIVLLHVVPPPRRCDEMMLESVAGGALEQGVRDAALAKVTERVEALINVTCMAVTGKAVGDGGPVCDLVTAHGLPTDEILRVAEDQCAEMIVLGTGGGKFLVPNQLGSVARQLTHLSRVPVLLVPNRGGCEPGTAA